MSIKGLKSALIRTSLFAAIKILYVYLTVHVLKDLWYIGSGSYEIEFSFFKELVQHHVSGQLKVAPEHCSAAVLDKMGKPHIEAYVEFSRKYFGFSKKEGKVMDGETTVWKQLRSCLATSLTTKC